MHGKYETNAWLVYGLGAAHVSQCGARSWGHMICKCLMYVQFTVDISVMHAQCGVVSGHAQPGPVEICLIHG